jgi:hypothetical protein
MKKAEIVGLRENGRSPGRKNHVFVQIFNKAALEKKFLDCSRRFW